MFRRLTPTLIPVMITLFGVILLMRGLFLPEYSVPNGKQMLYASGWGHQEIDDQLINKWYALRDKLITRRFFYCDLGWGVIALGITSLAILISRRAWANPQFLEIGTPRSVGVFYLLAAVTWLSFIPAHIFWINFTDARDDAPFVENMAVAFGESFAIALGVVGLPVILFGVWMVTRKKDLPVKIGAATGRETLISFAVWIAMILDVLICLVSIAFEPTLVPSCVLTLYLLLCGRAISLSPRRSDPRRGFEVVQPQHTAQPR